MSEYQYYEFQTIDKPLSESDQEELGCLSSRAHISSTGFTNEYNFGSFRGNPLKMMEQYFDTFLYVANWGTHCFMLRVPGNLIDLDLARQYCVGDGAKIHERGDYLIFEFTSESEDYEWEEGEGYMASLISLRSDLLRGDYRCLYLAWLYSAMICDVDENEVEPSVPPNLGELNSSLESFAEFMRIDTDLVEIAAENSISKQKTNKDNKELKDWIGELPSSEKDEIIFRLTGGNEPHLGNELLQRFQKQLSKKDQGNKGKKPRTAMELLQKAEVLEQEKRKRMEEEQLKEKVCREKELAIEREEYLNDLSRCENEIWEKTDELILTMKPDAYDQAVQNLIDLSELAEKNKTVKKFKTKLESIIESNNRKTSLLRRIGSAGLSNI